MATILQINDIRRTLDAQLLRLPGVQAVATGYKEVNGKTTKELAIIVYVSKKLPREAIPLGDTVPSLMRIQDVEIVSDVIEVGYYIPYSYTARLRPAKGGVSIGHLNITAGTLGGLVCDNESNDVMILSNNHVLADCNAGAAGDHIVQPGVYDGGHCHQDCIAELERFVAINFAGGTNYVDCAIARPNNAGDVSFEILDIGIPNLTDVYNLTNTDVENRLHVQKTGRTTQHTVGYVAAIDWKGSINYGAGVGTGYYEKQIVVKSLDGSDVSKGGDSGSFVLTMDDPARLCGLLFAGPASPPYTHYIANHISQVFNRLNVHLCCATRDVVEDSHAAEFLPDFRRMRDTLKHDRQLGKTLALYNRNSGKILQALRTRPDLREQAQAIFQDIGSAIRNPRQRVDKHSVEVGLQIADQLLAMYPQDETFRKDIERGKEILRKAEGKSINEVLRSLRD